MKEYDEIEAVKHIRNYMPLDIKDKYSDDDILIVIDTIFDYYDKKGFFDISADSDVDDEEELEVNDMIGYVKNQVRKDPDNVVEADDIMSIVLGELDYEEKLGIY